MGNKKKTNIIASGGCLVAEYAKIDPAIIAAHKGVPLRERLSEPVKAEEVSERLKAMSAEFEKELGL